MRFTLQKLVITFCLIVVCSYYGFSQNRFFTLINAAYDSAKLQRYQASLTLLYEAKALKWIDAGYKESVNFYLGSNYEALGQIDSCIYYYDVARVYYEKEKDSGTLSYIYNRLANAEIIFAKRYNKAIGYYQRQMEYDTAVVDLSKKMECLLNIGLAYKLLNFYDSALHYFNVVLADTHSPFAIKTKALRLVADIYSLYGKYDKALFYYNKAIRQLEGSGDTLELFNAYTNKGDCLLRQQKFKESLLSFEAAQQYMTNVIMDIQKKDLYHNLAEVYGQTNYFSKAFYYKNLEASIKDSINQQRTQKEAAEIEARYETRKNKDSLTIIQKTVALTKKESKDRLNTLIATLIGAAVICLIAFLALRNAALRKRANIKLSAQKARVEALADKLEEANQTKARLFSVISHDLRSPVSSLYASLKMQELKGENDQANDAVSTHIMHLLDTLEDLLTWSKSQMDRFTLQPVTLRITDMYTSLIELNQDAATSKQITIINKAERQVKIYTDENLLKTILRNVLANSIHHAPNKSTVVVDAAAYEEGVVCTISNEATATDAAILEERLQTAAIGSSKHGLGNVLIKEFTQKLNAGFEVKYADGKVYLQIKVPAIHKPANVLQRV